MWTESPIPSSFPARMRCPTRTDRLSVPTSNRPGLPASQRTWNFRLSGAAIKSTRVLLHSLIWVFASLFNMVRSARIRGTNGYEEGGLKDGVVQPSIAPGASESELELHY